MSCPICGNKPANCDCTPAERDHDERLEALEAENAELKQRLEVVERWIHDMDVRDMEASEYNE